MLAHALPRDTAFAACLRLFRQYPLAIRRHYAEHRGKPFFEGLVAFITSAPLVALALEGPKAISIVRAINGATRPHEAAPGTIRGDFGTEMMKNVVHASDSDENAKLELARFFKPEELFTV